MSQDPSRIQAISAIVALWAASLPGCGIASATDCSDTLSDTNNCGACGHVCLLPNATAACVAGACFVESCTGPSSWWDANGVEADGCEYYCVASGTTEQNCVDELDDDCDGAIDLGGFAGRGPDPDCAGHYALRISSDAVNVDVGALVAAAGATFDVLDVIVEPGVTVSSATSTLPAMTLGTLPAGTTVRITNQGAIVGTGGAGGNGGSQTGSFTCAPPTAGESGGPALEITTNTVIDNRLGIIGGGGGGGGGGGAGSFRCRTPGSGGGGGAQGGAGGLGGSGLDAAGNPISANDGSAGATTGGAGGSPVSGGGTGGRGGDYGRPGESGSLGGGAGGQPGGLGGAAGDAVWADGYLLDWVGPFDSARVEGAIVSHCATARCQFCGNTGSWTLHLRSVASPACPDIDYTVDLDAGGGMATCLTNCSCWSTAYEACGLQFEQTCAATEPIESIQCTATVVGPSTSSGTCSAVAAGGASCTYALDATGP